MVVHEELQSPGLQQVACMVQLTYLRYCPCFVGATLLQNINQAHTLPTLSPRKVHKTCTVLSPVRVMTWCNQC